jgi:two-component system invasion response regulator UvrY
MTRSDAALRLMLVDDHPIVRRGVRDILADAFPSSSIEEVGSGGEALSKIRSHRWDLVILDLTLPDGSGLDVLEQARDAQSQLPVLILSMHAPDQFARRAVAAGAAGYLTKDTADTELVTAVTKIIRGATHFASDAFEEVALDHPERAEPHKRLSEREHEVFLLIAQGKTVSAIATELGLSIKTVSTYRRRVLVKMNMASNSELYRYAIRHSLVN